MTSNNRNCDSRRKELGFDYVGEFKRKRNCASTAGGHHPSSVSTAASRRFLKAHHNSQLMSRESQNEGTCQSNLSFFQVADCISEEAECSVDEEE